MIRLFDLAGAADACRFSPNCWRVRLALAHKGLACETVPWRFTEKDAIAHSGQGLVPVIEDRGRVVHDSFAIARYLDEAYPDRPALMGDARHVGLTLLVKHWVERSVNPVLIRLILPELFEVLHAKDRDYFRQSREARFGASLEAVALPAEGGIAQLRAALAPARATLELQPWLAGPEPAFADHVLMGAFMWARAVSRLELVATDDPVRAWYERMLDAYGGVARAARAAA